MEHLKVVMPVQLDQKKENTQTLKPSEYKRYCSECDSELSDLQLKKRIGFEHIICELCEEKNRKLKEEEKNKRGIEKFGLKAWKEFSLESFKSTIDNKKAFEMANEFDASIHNYYIFGKCGTGKSHLAYGIVIKFFEKIGCLIIKPPALMRNFRMIEPEEEKEKLNYLKDVPILLIDDLGIGKSTEFANQVLYEIIDMRLMDIRNGLIITSNLSIDEFSKKCEDDRLPSRLAGMCKLIELKGKDFRISN